MDSDVPGIMVPGSVDCLSIYNSTSRKSFVVVSMKENAFSFRHAPRVADQIVCRNSGLNGHVSSDSHTLYQEVHRRFTS